MAYGAYNGSGQSPVSPLALRLAQQPITSPWQLAGNLAMVAADAYGRKRDTEKRASSVAEMLAGAPYQQLASAGAGGTLPGGGVTSGGQGPSNPQYGQLAELLTNSPDLIPAFESAALQRQFPDLFNQPEMGTYYDPQQRATLYGYIRPGMMAEAPSSGWQNAGGGSLYREGPGGQIEWQQAPGSGGGIGDLFTVGGATGAPGGGGVAPMAAIGALESGGQANPVEATSPKGAVGQFQLMPATALDIARQKGDAYVVRVAESDALSFRLYIRDPAINQEYGAFYFDQLRQKYGNDVLAAAAYNAGPGRVDQALAAIGGQVTQANLPQFLAQLPQETQAYIAGDGQRAGFIQRTSGQGAQGAAGGNVPAFVPPASGNSAEAAKLNAEAFAGYVQAYGLYDRLDGQQKALVDRVNAERERTLGAERFTQSNTIRDEFVRETKPLGEVLAGYNRIKEGAQLGTGAGDVAVVFGYMKMLDPTSVVREGEYANVRNAAGVPEQLMAEYNRLIGGGVLSNDQRQQIIGAAERLAVQTRSRFDQLSTSYGGLAERFGLDPATVLVDVTGLSGFAPATGANATTAPADPKPGDIVNGYRFKGGDKADPNAWGLP